MKQYYEFGDSRHFWNTNDKLSFCYWLLTKIITFLYNYKSLLNEFKLGIDFIGILPLKACNSKWVKRLVDSTTQLAKSWLGDYSGSQAERLACLPKSKLDEPWAAIYSDHFGYWTIKSVHLAPLIFSPYFFTLKIS